MRWIWKVKVGASVKPTPLVCHVLVMPPLPEPSIKCEGLKCWTGSSRDEFVFVFASCAAQMSCLSHIFVTCVFSRSM